MEKGVLEEDMPHNGFSGPTRLRTPRHRSNSARMTIERKPLTPASAASASAYQDALAIASEVSLLRLQIKELAKGQRRIEVQIDGWTKNLEKVATQAVPTRDPEDTKPLALTRHEDKSDDGRKNGPGSKSGTWAKEVEEPPLGSGSAAVVPVDSGTSKKDATSHVPIEQVTVLGLLESLLRKHNCDSIAKFVHAFRLRWEAFIVPEEPKNTLLYRIVASQLFGIFCFFVIFLNTLAMVYQAELAINAAARNHHIPNEGVWFVVDLCFLSFYIIELLLKIHVYRKMFFIGGEAGWNLFDTALVAFGIFEVISSISRSAGSNNCTFMRTIRICKVSKVMRTTKALKSFSELRLMLDMLLCSLGSLWWACVLLFFIMFLFGLFLMQEVTSYLLLVQGSGSPLPKERLDELMDLFGTVTNTVFTLFQAVSGGNDWIEFYSALKPTEFGGIGYTVFITIFTISVLNIVSSVFVDKALKLGKPDEDDPELQAKQAQIRESAESLLQFFHQKAWLYGDHGALITTEEIKEAFAEEETRKLLDLHRISLSDTLLFFNMMVKHQDKEPNATPSVPLEAFMDGLFNMKGQASSIDASSLKYQLKTLKASQDKMFKSLLNAVKHKDDTRGY